MQGLAARPAGRDRRDGATGAAICVEFEHRAIDLRAVIARQRQMHAGQRRDRARAAEHLHLAAAIWRRMRWLRSNGASAAAASSTIAR